MADEPTWPLANPSPASSWPAISLSVLQKLEGAEHISVSMDTTLRSSDRGYT